MYQELISKHAYIIPPKKEYASLKDEWDNTDDAIWMLNTYYNLYPENNREISLVKGKCAFLVFHLLEDKRSRNAVRSAISYGRCEISKDDLEKSYSEAFEAKKEYIEKYYLNCNMSVYASNSVAVIASSLEVNPSTIVNPILVASTDSIEMSASYRQRIENKLKKKMSDICRTYLNVP